MIIAATPIKPGTILAPYTIGLERIVSEMAPCHTLREIDININRSRIQGMIRQIHARKGITHVLLLDSDVVVTKDALDRLIAAWSPGITPCARTKGETNHVLAACALIGIDDYLAINYLDKIIECQCAKVPGPFYVDGANAYEENAGHVR